MRTLSILVASSFLLLGGCNIFSLNSPMQKNSHISPSTPPPNAEDLVAYLNANANLIQSIRCPVELTASQGIKSVPLKGQMACDKPRNFRMKASLFGKDFVDIGSNDKEFWFWMNEGQDPVVAHCSYEDLETKQVRLPFPFQPEMLVAALGMANYDPRGNYDVKRNKEGNVEMGETVVNSAGKTLKKVTIFYGAQVSAPEPQVLAHKIYDDKGTLLCEALIDRTILDRATNAVLPVRMTIRLPQEKTVLSLNMRDIQSAQITPEDGANLFSRRSLQHYQGLDLATGRKDPPGSLGQLNSIQRTSGKMQDTRFGW